MWSWRKWGIGGSRELEEVGSWRKWGVGESGELEEVGSWRRVLKLGVEVADWMNFNWKCEYKKIGSVGMREKLDKRNLKFGK